MVSLSLDYTTSLHASCLYHIFPAELLGRGDSDSSSAFHIAQILQIITTDDHIPRPVTTFFHFIAAKVMYKYALKLLAFCC